MVQSFRLGERLVRTRREADMGSICGLAGLLVSATSLVACQGVPARDEAVGSSQQPLVATVQAQGAVYPGIYPLTVTGGYANYLPDLTDLGTIAGKPVAFAGTFVNVVANLNETVGLLDTFWSAGATPVINIDVYAPAAEIANGTHDGAIRAWADQVELWLDQGGGRSLIIIPLQEMNGDWVDWGVDPVSYRYAYNRFVTIFRRDMGIDETKVRFAWGPNDWSSPPHTIADYYPGAGVDLVGYTAYDWNTSTSAAGVVLPTANTLRGLVPELPYFVFQTGTGYAPITSSGKTTWVTALFDTVRDDPNLVGFVYFNMNKEEDWRVWENPTLNPGWSDRMDQASTIYGHPLSDWFAPGTLLLPNHAGPLCAPATQCDTVALVSAEPRFMVLDTAASNSPVRAYFFGGAGAQPVMGDWNCDGEKTPGVLQAGYVHARDSNSGGTNDYDYEFGDPGDVPIAGDWNGDGCDSLGLYRPTERRFLLSFDMNASVEAAFSFGPTGALPLAGDADGDGWDSVGAFAAGTVHLTNAHHADGQDPPTDEQFDFGDSGDQAILGDWDGDGSDTPGVYRPSTRRVYLRNVNSQGNADYGFYVGSFANVIAGRVPVPAGGGSPGGGSSVGGGGGNGAAGVGGNAHGGGVVGAGGPAAGEGDDEASGSCGCRVAGHDEGAWPAWWALLAFAPLARRCGSSRKRPKPS